MLGLGMKTPLTCFCSTTSFSFYTQRGSFFPEQWAVSPKTHIMQKNVATNVHFNSKYFFQTLCINICVCACISVSFIYSSSSPVCLPVLEDSLLLFSHNHKWLSYWNSILRLGPPNLATTHSISVLTVKHHRWWGLEKPLRSSKIATISHEETGSPRG